MLIPILLASLGCMIQYEYVSSIPESYDEPDPFDPDFIDCLIRS